MTRHQRILITALALSLSTLGGISVASAASHSRADLSSKHLRAMLAWAKHNTVTPEPAEHRILRATARSVELVRLGNRRCQSSGVELCMNGRPVVDKLRLSAQGHSRAMTTYYRPVRGIMQLQGFWLEGRHARGAADVMGFLSDDNRRWHIGARVALARGIANAKTIQPIDIQDFMADFVGLDVDSVFDSVQAGRFVPLSESTMERLLDGSFAPHSKMVDVASISDAAEQTGSVLASLDAALRVGGPHDRVAGQRTGKSMAKAKRRASSSRHTGLWRWVVGQLAKHRTSRLTAEYVVTIDDETLREVFGL